MSGELTGYVEGYLDGTGMQGARKRVGVNEFVYIQVPATTAAGTPLVVTYDGDEEVMVKGVAPATLAVYQEIAIVPTLQGSAAGFQWCQVRGFCSALVLGTTDVAKDDYLEVLNGGTSLVMDSTARSVNSVAIACEAYTTSSDALKSVQLTGDRVIVAAS
jgi:hypothetical protein